MHPHLNDNWPVLPLLTRGVPTTGAVAWSPREGSTVEAPHFWSSTLLPNFQGFLLKPVRKLRGKLRKTSQGPPQTGNNPPLAMLRGGSKDGVKAVKAKR